MALAIGPAFALLVWASGVTSWPDRLGGMRRVNTRDELFRYVAQELDEPALCEKIPWSALSPGGFFIAPSFERSECYQFIAARTRSAWICWKVRRLGAITLLDRQTSMRSCLGNVRQGLQEGISVTPADLVRFFAELGYDPDALDLEGFTPPLARRDGLGAKDLPVDAAYQVYRRFLDVLSRPSDDRQVQARHRFIARVQELQSDN